MHLRMTIMLCAVGTAATAQQLQLTANNGVPAGVRVHLHQQNGHRDTVLVADSRGRVALPADGYPWQITIRSVRYGHTTDTIAARWGKVMWLEPETIQEVVVTGQYGARTADNAVQRIEVIDRRKIEAMAAQNLKDVLTNQLEIRMDNDPILGTAMSMQGSRRYGADAKILIDGVPVTGKLNGAVDLSQINLANIERVEIIKGPMSVSYGTDAIAGTVNLITRKQVDHNSEVYAGTYYETAGTYNTTFGGGVRAGAHSLRVDAFRNFFAGWNPGNGPSFFQNAPRLADTGRWMLWKPREQYQAAIQYVYSRGKTSLNYKSNNFYEVITNRGMPLSPYREMAFDNRFLTTRLDNALYLNQEMPKGAHINAFVAYNAYKRIKEDIANDLTTLTETKDPALQDTSKYSEVNSRATYATANNVGKLDYEAGYDVNVQYANSTQITDREQRMANYAVFGSAEYRPYSRLTLRPGVRLAYNTRYSAPVVPSLHVMYKPGNFTLRSSWARGFRQPGLKDLYFDFVDINHNIHGNTDLKAESSDNWLASVGYSVRQGNANWRFNISGWYNDVRDLITLVLKPGGATNEYWYQNISHFVTKGMQLNADVQAGRWTVSAGGSCMGTYNQLSEISDVPAFSYSPEVRGSITRTFPWHSLSVSAFYKYTGRAVVYILNSDTNTPQQSRMGSYHIADVTVSGKVWHQRITLAGGCKNLFDVTNILSGGGDGSAHFSAATTAAVGMGRYYFVKTEIRLHGKK